MINEYEKPSLNFFKFHVCDLTNAEVGPSGGWTDPNAPGLDLGDGDKLE